VCALLANGCGVWAASAAPKAVRTATPVAIDESLKTFDDPANRERVANLMGSPEMQRAMVALGTAAAEGAVDTASSGDSEQRLTQLTTQITDAFTSALARSFDEHRSLVQSGAADATHAAMGAASQDLRESLGPAIRESFVTALRAPDLREALNETVADAAKAARASVQEPHERPLLERLHNLVTFAWLVALAFVIAMAVLYVRVYRSRRRVEASRRAGAEEVVSRVLEKAKGEPWSKQLRDVLTEALAEVAPPHPPSPR
jgi:hypothetical protein